jgi:DNA-binding MarR family transcriptional regulator
MKVEEFEELKSSSIGHNIIKAGRIYSEFALNEVKKQFKEFDLRQSHMQLFPLIPFEGITIVELADRLNISKQAVSVLVKDLLDKRILVKIDHPIDKRSFLVTFNQKKGANIFQGMKLLSQLDEKIIEKFGERKAKDLNKMLNIIIKDFNHD